MKSFEGINSQGKENTILNDLGNNHKLLKFIEKFIDLRLDKNSISYTSTVLNIDPNESNELKSTIYLKKINDIRFINKFFESINLKLSHSGIFVGKAETYLYRRKKLIKKYPFIIYWLVYFFDLLFSRVFPKLFLTKKIYFHLTKGKGRVLSKAEIFGRLYYCGFQIVEEKIIDNILYFVAKKVKDPVFNNNPNYGLFISLKRVGKNNKKINVCKFRTMHPFSEYLQEYIYKKNSLQSGGKIKDDFRISPEGKFFRRFWIDELPMLINILKGDMKLVGVRPLSPHFFSLYTKELQDLRTQFKPGFIPPFYVDLPKTMNEIMDSEKRYLKLCQKSELKTDIKYFFLAFKNVLFKGVRSS